MPDQIQKRADVEPTFIINPTSAAGRTKKRWDQIRSLLHDHFESWKELFTTGPKHAEELARAALRAGDEFIVAVGGDGTIHEVVNGFFDPGEPGKLVRENATLGVLTTGTGSDFIRTIGRPAGDLGAVQRLAAFERRRIDVGYATLTPYENECTGHVFINIADFGLGGEVVKRVNASSKVLGGKLSFALSTLGAIFSYKPRSISYKVDDGEKVEGKYVSVVIANGRYFGGGMCPAPDAELDDGLLDFMFIGEMSAFETIRSSRSIYRRGFREHDKVTRARGRKLEVWSDEEVLIDLDGEQPGVLPATFEVLRGKIYLVG
ncbi:MAG: diacylglycerol kinase family lipid kinase [Planctomycetes bacterium]|nr:diacylglycerol kinase family lipid kinase [Planctomycetota bacterium]